MQILLVSPGPDVSRALSALGHRVREGVAASFTPADDLVLALGSVPSDLSALPSVLWAREDPWRFEPNPRVHRVFSADLNAAARYTRPAEVLPPSFDDLAPLPEPKEKAEKEWDLCLAGDPHPRRLLVLQALRDLMPSLNILGPGAPSSEWSHAKVVLVVSRDAMEGNLRRIPPFSPGQELYEAAGLGCCVVTDRTRAGAFEAYEEGKELLAYESIRALPALIGALLEDPDRRRVLASAGRTRTLAEHTIQHRLAHLLERCGTGSL